MVIPQIKRKKNNMALIKKGSEGDSVKEIQKALGIAADGIFGSGTESRVN